MPVIATDVQRLSNWLKGEYAPDTGFCRKDVVVNEASQVDYEPGVVLSRTLVSGSATATATSGNTGTGTMGSVTVLPTARKGTYVLTIVTAGATGAFTVTSPDGKTYTGAVASAFSGGGLSFTLADGTPDFAVGDSFIIEVAGTEKYKKVEVGTINDSLVIFISDRWGNAGKTTIAAATDTPVVALVKGPARVGKAALKVGASINTDAEKAAVYAQLEAKNINVEIQV